MIDAEEHVRSAVRDLADEARPTFLGERALRGVRRRTRRLTVGSGLALAALVIGVTTWPYGLGTQPVPEAVPSDPPASAVASGPWEAFPGLGRTPVSGGGGDTDRLVIASYATTPGGPAHILDPTTGRYRTSDLDAVLAVSPDLRFAVVKRLRAEADPTGDPVEAEEYGIYDTVAGTVLGRLDIDAHLAPPTQYAVSRGDWSPDGRHLALSVRRAVPGLGWQAAKLLVVDVTTGAVRAVTIRPSDGLEPVDLIGWSTGGRAVAFAADRTGTDEATSGHVVYDLSGRAIAAHPWPGQANAVRLVRTDDVALIPMGGAEIEVMGLLDGTVRRRYPTDVLRTVTGWENPMSWRGDEIIVQPEDCTSDGCSVAPRLLGVDASTGRTRVLRTLPEPQQGLLIQPVVAPTSSIMPAW